VKLYRLRAGEILAGDRDSPISRLHGRTMRELLQRLGDHARGELGPDVFTSALVDRAVEAGDWFGSSLVVSDVRLERELDWAREEGARVWWISAREGPRPRPHITEGIAALRVKCYQDGDASIANVGTLEQLFEHVDRVLASQGLSFELEPLARAFEGGDSIISWP
jgi:hypothetical protein